jgi:hypothetical protein
MGEDRDTSAASHQPTFVSNDPSDETRAADTERTIPPLSAGLHSDEATSATPTESTRAPAPVKSSEQFSAVHHRASATAGQSPPTQQTRPAPARELDLQQGQGSSGSEATNDKEGDGNTTLQSMMRPEMMAHVFADPRRFLSIERELSEAGAAIKFLEKRLVRAEKDNRIALAVAALGVLLAVLSFIR